MAVTLADHQHCGNDPQMDKPTKNYVGAKISATIFLIRGNTSKGSTPPFVSKSRSRRRTGIQKDKKLHLRRRETRERCDKLLMTLLTVKLRTQEWSFLNRSHHQTTSEPSESRNRRLHTKDRACKRLQTFMWKCRVLQSIHGAFIVWLHCKPIDPLGLSTSKHKSTQMICSACSTPGMISSLHSIMSSPATGIKPMLVSRSTTQNRGRNKTFTALFKSR